MEDDFEDDFDSLREKSTRTSSVYDDLEAEESGEGGVAGTIRQYSPAQRLILAFLLFIDVIAFSFAVLILTGLISF